MIKENYQVFADTYSESLNTIGTELRKSNTTFGNSQSFISIVENTQNQNTISSFKNNYISYLSADNKQAASGSSNKPDNLDHLNEIRREYVNEILTSVNNYTNPEDYISWLDYKFEEIYTSEDLKVDDKDFLLTYLTVYNVSLTFLIENVDLIPQASNDESIVSPFDLNNTRSGFRDWLERNLKCVAGVAGSAISIGIGGCAAGAQVGGSVGLLGGPAGAASGALTGCLLGGAIGAIGGGLVGYATFC